MRALVLVLCLSLCGVALAATCQWTGNTNALASDPTNWSCGNIPMDTDDVIIPDVNPAPQPTFDTLVECSTFQASGNFSVTDDVIVSGLVVVSAPLAVMGTGVMECGAGLQLTAAVSWDSISLEIDGNVTGTGSLQVRRLETRNTHFEVPVTFSGISPRLSGRNSVTFTKDVTAQTSVVFDTLTTATFSAAVTGELRLEEQITIVSQGATMEDLTLVSTDTYTFAGDVLTLSGDLNWGAAGASLDMRQLGQLQGTFSIIGTQALQWLMPANFPPGTFPAAVKVGLTLPLHTIQCGGLEVTVFAAPWVGANTLPCSAAGCTRITNNVTLTASALCSTVSIPPAIEVLGVLTFDFGSLGTQADTTFLGTGIIAMEETLGIEHNVSFAGQMTLVVADNAQLDVPANANVDLPGILNVDRLTLSGTGNVRWLQDSVCTGTTLILDDCTAESDYVVDVTGVGGLVAGPSFGGTGALRPGTLSSTNTAYTIGLDIVTTSALSGNMVSLSNVTVAAGQVMSLLTLTNPSITVTGAAHWSGEGQVLVPATVTLAAGATLTVALDVDLSGATTFSGGDHVRIAASLDMGSHSLGLQGVPLLILEESITGTATLTLPPMVQVGAQVALDCASVTFMSSELALSGEHNLTVHNLAISNQNVTGQVAVRFVDASLTGSVSLNHVVLSGSSVFTGASTLTVTQVTAQAGSDTQLQALTSLRVDSLTGPTSAMVTLPTSMTAIGSSAVLGVPALLSGALTATGGTLRLTSSVNTSSHTADFSGVSLLRLESATITGAPATQVQLPAALFAAGVSVLHNQVTFAADTTVTGTGTIDLKQTWTVANVVSASASLAVPATVLVPSDAQIAIALVVRGPTLFNFTGGAPPTLSFNRTLDTSTFRLDMSRMEALVLRSDVTGTGTLVLPATVTLSDANRITLGCALEVGVAGGSTIDASGTPVTLTGTGSLTNTGPLTLVGSGLQLGPGSVTGSGAVSLPPSVTLLSSFIVASPASLGSGTVTVSSATTANLEFTGGFGSSGLRASITTSGAGAGITVSGDVTIGAPVTLSGRVSVASGSTATVDAGGNTANTLTLTGTLVSPGAGLVFVPDLRLTVSQWSAAAASTGFVQWPNALTVSGTNVFGCPVTQTGTTTLVGSGSVELQAAVTLSGGILGTQAGGDLIQLLLPTGSSDITLTGSEVALANLAIGRSGTTSGPTFQCPSCSVRLERVMQDADYDFGGVARLIVAGGIVGNNSVIVVPPVVNATTSVAVGPRIVARGNATAFGGVGHTLTLSNPSLPTLEGTSGSVPALNFANLRELVTAWDPTVHASVTLPPLVTITTPFLRHEGSTVVADLGTSNVTVTGSYATGSGATLVSRVASAQVYGRLIFEPSASPPPDPTFGDATLTFEVAFEPASGQVLVEVFEAPQGTVDAAQLNVNGVPLYASFDPECDQLTVTEASTAITTIKAYTVAIEDTCSANKDDFPVAIVAGVCGAVGAALLAVAAFFLYRCYQRRDTDTISLDKI